MKKKHGFIGQYTRTLTTQQILEAKKNPILSSLFTTDIGYYPHARGHFREREQGCEQNILIYCVDGIGWIKTDGKKRKINANEYFILPAYKAHQYGADSHKPWSIYWFHFVGEKAGHFLDSGRIKIHKIDTPESSRFRERIFLFQEIVENLEQGLGQTNMEYASTCLWHLLGSFRFVAAYRKIKQVKTSSKVESSIYFMNEHVDRSLSLQELARQCGLSISHYCLVFKKHSSSSPFEYFTHLKIQKACTMLDLGSKSIKEIAHSLGYDDQYYFTRVFTKTMGMAPTLYRDRKKG